MVSITNLTGRDARCPPKRRCLRQVAIGIGYHVSFFCESSSEQRRAEYRMLSTMREKRQLCQSIPFYTLATEDQAARGINDLGGQYVAGGFPVGHTLPDRRSVMSDT